MYDLLTRAHPERVPYELPLEAESLRHLTDAIDIQNELGAIDLSLMCGALQGIRDCFLRDYFERNEPHDPHTFYLGQFIERQRRLMLSVIGEQVDRSGLSTVLAHWAPRVFADYDLSGNQDLIRIETVLLQDLGISEDDIRVVAQRAEENKQYLFELMSSPSFSVRAILAGDPWSLNWSAFGATLAGVNIGAACMPEPIVSKGVAIASAIMGLGSSLVPAK